MQDRPLLVLLDLHVNSHEQKPLHAGNFGKLIADPSLCWLAADITPR